MRILLTLFILGSFCMPTSAQKDIPAFGKIEIADLNLKDCEFEPGVAAFKLLDFGDVEYELGENGFRMKMTRRTRIKIFNKNGFDQADVKLRYYSKNNYENITNLSAKTYNLDGSGKIVTSNLEKSSIFSKKIDKHYSELIFTMPEVKEGSIIEFKYNVYLESISNLRDWHFQDLIPTRLSVYRVLIPSYFVFMTNLYTTLPLEDTKTVEDLTMAGGRQGRINYVADRRVLRMKDLPSLKSEPYMSSFRDYTQRVEFQLSKIIYGPGDEKQVMSTWPMLSQQLLDDEDFGMHIKKNIPVPADLKQLLSGIKDPYKKMTMVYDYLRNSMNWNGINGIYCFSNLKTVWDNKSATTSEINFLLLNWLKQEGVEVYPILVSSRDHGAVNELSPFLYQFNTVMAYVEINNTPYILDASEKFNPVGLIPFKVMNTKGFVVDVMHGGFVTLFNSRPLKNIVAINAKILEHGAMEGEAKVYSYDYARVSRVKKLNDAKDDFINYFRENNTSLKVDSFKVTNRETDSLALEQLVHYKMVLNTSGEYKYFTLNMFSGLSSNPFITNERITDIDFGTNQSYTVHGNFMLPDNYEMLEKPKDIYILSPDSSITFQRISQLSGNVLQARLSFLVNRPFYPASVYSDLKEFYRKLYELLEEQVVIQKKQS